MTALQSRLPWLSHYSPAYLAIALLAAVVFVIIIVILVLPSTDRLPDMKAYAAGSARKTAFFDYLTPIIESENRAIIKDRQRLLELSVKLAAGGNPSLFDNQRIRSLADQFLVAREKVESNKVLDQLLQRVDSIPVSLVLVQAAKESGWGTSKFAREGNNLFGQWCYQEGCGIVPSRRSDGASHEVQVFDSVGDAVTAYLHNLNTGKFYRRLRDIRSQIRSARKIPDALSLADGLLLYSERRQAYVDEVKQMIRQYRKFQSGHHQ